MEDQKASALAKAHAWPAGRPEVFLNVVRRSACSQRPGRAAAGSRGAQGGRDVSRGVCPSHQVGAPRE